MNLRSRLQRIALGFAFMNADQPTSTTAAETTEFSIHRLVREAEEFARKEPAKAVATAFGAGLLLNLLPTRVIVGTITAVAVPFMRPALLALGLIKACEMCCTDSKTEAGDEGDQ